MQSIHMHMHTHSILLEYAVLFFKNLKTGRLGWPLPAAHARDAQRVVGNQLYARRKKMIDDDDAVHVPLHAFVYMLYSDSILSLIHI